MERNFGLRVFVEDRDFWIGLSWEREGVLRGLRGAGEVVEDEESCQSSAISILVSGVWVGTEFGFWILLCGFFSGFDLRGPEGFVNSKTVNQV